MPIEPQEIVKIAEEIQQYLRTHPHAADSCEGIVRWWLTRQRIHEASDAVQQALDYLVATGSASRHAQTSGTVIYTSASK